MIGDIIIKLGRFLLLLWLCILVQPEEVSEAPLGRPLYVFVHIPRTGGVAFGAAMSEVVGKKSVCHMRHAFQSNEPWPNLLGRLALEPALQQELNESMSRCDVLWDHFDYSVPQLLQRVTNRKLHVITQLRKPVDRFLSSHFKQFRSKGPEGAHSELQRRITAMENGVESTTKHMLLGYLSGCATPFDLTLFRENCADADGIYAAALKSVQNTTFLGLSTDPAAALRKFFRESDFATRLPVTVLSELSRKAAVPERWYANVATDDDRARLASVFEQDELLYRAAEAKVGGVPATAKSSQQQPKQQAPAEL